MRDFERLQELIGGEVQGDGERLLLRKGTSIYFNEEGHSYGGVKKTPNVGIFGWVTAEELYRIHGWMVE